MEIRIIDDLSTEMNETLILYLSSGAGVFLSPFAQAEVTIIDNDDRVLVVLLCMKAVHTCIMYRNGVLD